MPHAGKRDVMVRIIAAQSSRTKVVIDRPGITKSYYPNHKRLADIEELLSSAIRSGSYDFELELFENSIWLTVYGL